MMKRILAMLMCLTLLFSSSNVVFAVDSLGYNGFYEASKATYDYSFECGDGYVDDNIDNSENDNEYDNEDNSEDDNLDDNEDDSEDDNVDDNSHTYENGICIYCGVAEWDTDGDGVLEILALGNSFSTDALQYAYQIAQDLGIEEIVIGNLYIAACTLEMHAAYAANNLATYTYYYNDNGTWVSFINYRISTALDSRSWDYVSLQEGSPVSGMESSYNENLTDLISYVQAHSDARLVWHMTWAYQQNSTHSAFNNYNKDQMTMYNAIVAAVQNKIVTNDNFDLIVPNGTTVQNSRTSLLGDTTTRDGYHMSYDYGRYLTGLSFIKNVTGLSMDEITYKPEGVDSLEQKVAIESVNNASVTPFAVTKSSFDSKVPIEGYTELHTKLFKGAYWYPTNANRYNELVYDTKKSQQCFATIRFTRDTLPLNSIIILENGWKYRPDAWITDTVQTGTREPLTTQPYTVVTEEWWGDYTIRAFNISLVSGDSVMGLTDEEMHSVFRIYVPGELAHIYDQQVATDAYKATDASCTETATYYYSCICGEKGTETFAYGEFAPHMWTPATTEAPKTCTECGETEGEPLEIEVTGIKLDKTSLVISAGKTSTLKVKISPDDASNKTLTWSTSNKKIVTVDKNGKVKGIKAGTATITVKTANGKTAKCKVTVVKATMNATSVILQKNASIKLKVTSSLKSDKASLWKSSNKKIVTVDKNGKIKGMKAGTATITVTMKSGVTATCKVTVKVPSVTLKKTTATIKVGKTTTIKVKSKFPASDKVASYKSSNKKIATVDKKGKVKGIKAGKATITVKMKSGATAKFKVTVKRK